MSLIFAEDIFNNIPDTYFCVDLRDQRDKKLLFTHPIHPHCDYHYRVWVAPCPIAYRKTSAPYALSQNGTACNSMNYNRR